MPPQYTPLPQTGQRCSITETELLILVINQLKAKFLFYNKFIICLYMFRALCSHHQEVKLYYTASGIITRVGGRPVHRFREDWSAKYQNLKLNC